MEVSAIPDLPSAAPSSLREFESKQTLERTQTLQPTATASATTVATKQKKRKRKTKIAAGIGASAVAVALIALAAVLFSSKGGKISAKGEEDPQVTKPKVEPFEEIERGEFKKSGEEWKNKKMDYAEALPKDAEDFAKKYIDEFYTNPALRGKEIRFEMTRFGNIATCSATILPNTKDKQLVTQYITEGKEVKPKGKEGGYFTQSLLHIQSSNPEKVESLIAGETAAICKKELEVKRDAPHTNMGEADFHISGELHKTCTKKMKADEGAYGASMLFHTQEKKDGERTEVQVEFVGAYEVSSNSRSTIFNDKDETAKNEKLQSSWDPKTKSFAIGEKKYVSTRAFGFKKMKSIVDGENHSCSGFEVDRFELAKGDAFVLNNIRLNDLEPPIPQGQVRNRHLRRALDQQLDPVVVVGEIIKEWTRPLDAREVSFPIVAHFTKNVGKYVEAKSKNVFTIQVPAEKK